MTSFLDDGSITPAGALPTADTSTLTSDQRDVSRDDAPDIGAYEFVAAGADKQTPTLSWAPIGPITYGTNLTGQLDASSGSVAGSFAYTIGGQPVTASTVLDASATPYTIVATFTPTNATNSVSGGTTQQTLTVNQAMPTPSWASSARSYATARI